MSNKKVETHPSLIFADDIKAICAPLKDLGIHYFSHVCVDEKGGFAALGMNPEFAKLYAEKKYYNFDIHMAKLRQPEQYILWDMVTLKKESRELNEDFKSFGIGHTFTIVKQAENGRECFNFAGKLSNDSINNSYLQNLDLLKKFINYFNDKTKSYKELQKAYDIKFQLEEKTGGYFTAEDLGQINTAAFNKKIATERFYLGKDNYLTKRELECLYWLAQGKTLEETAIILAITTRTVKAHISNIKEKFACDNQFQLGMIFQQLSKLNIFE